MPQRKSHFPGSTSSTTPQKRRLNPSTSTPSTRQSKRIKSTPVSSKTKTTPKKSPYFEDPTDSESESVPEKEESGYEDESASLASAPPSEVDDDDEESEEHNSSEEEKKPKKRGRKPKTNGVTPTTLTSQKGQELWRPGVKTSLEPGKEVFIALPKARPAGSTPYKDHTIHPNTLLFLSDLRKNNDREWLKVHDADYRASKADFDAFVSCLTTQIIEKADETIPELPPKDLTFRIYRDIRFSPDPTPYKTHFSAAWSRTGRKGPYAAYYVQIQPGGCFVGGGIWHPEAAPLALLRRDVDGRSERIKKVLIGKDLNKTFLGGARGEKEAVKKFVEINQESALKTKPKGYEADNPNIALLRLRNYTIGKKLRDEEVLGEGGLERVLGLIAVLAPFVCHVP